MITPRQFETWPDGAVGVAQSLEDAIISIICRALRDGIDPEKAAPANSVVQAQIRRALQDFVNDTYMEADGVYVSTYESVVNGENYLYRHFGKDTSLTSSDVMHSMLRSELQQTQGTLLNLSRSAGFVIDGRYTLATYAYQAALDRTIRSIRGGTAPYAAIRDTVIRLTNSGVKTVEYDSGYTKQIDVAVRECVVTGMHQLSERIISVQQAELGANLTLMSQHADARDKSDMPENHKLWQNNIFWLFWPEGGYRPYTDVGEGTVTGYRGVNCRHSRRIWFDGVTERPDDIVDVDPIEYGGKSYDAYEATQRQRQIERNIRFYKRRLVGMEEAGVTSDDKLYRKSSNLLSRWNAEYAKFSEAAGLRMQSHRTQFAGFGRGQAARARAAANAYRKI